MGGAILSKHPPLLLFKRAWLSLVEEEDFVIMDIEGFMSDPSLRKGPSVSVHQAEVALRLGKYQKRQILIILHTIVFRFP